MLLIRITRPASIEVNDEPALRLAWKTYTPGIIGEYVVRKALSARQLRRLPRDLRERVVCETGQD